MSSSSFFKIVPGGAIFELGGWRQKRRQMPNHDASKSRKQKI
jgi:hypothetical protein